MERVKDYSIEKELEVYKSIMDALPQSMFLLDKHKNIIGIFNATPEMLAGLSVDDLIGKNILEYADNPSSPFYQACSMLNTAFDPVFSTGIPMKFQYMIFDSHLEATVTKLSGERILSQVQNITDIVLKQKDIENKKHNELSMALMAGGIVSWKYDVQNDIISSVQDNNVIQEDMPLDKLISLIDPEHRQTTIDMFDTIIRHGATLCHITVPVLNRDGVMQWSDVHAIPHEYAPDGSVTLIIGSQKDISKEYEANKKLKKLLKQNELILNNTSSGFVFLTPDLKVEWENISTTFSDPEILMLFCKGELHDDTCNPSFCSGKNIIQQALRTQAKSTGKFKTSGGIIVESIAQPVFNEEKEIEGIVLRIDDITEQEESLCELAKAKEKAEQSDKLKLAFLANMSHEIRTPLNSIMGFVQLIPDAETREERQEYTDIVNSNGEMLLNLINDILDLSKIEAGYINCNNTIFNLSDLIEELDTIFRHKLSKDIELICDIPCEKYLVNLDRVRISQIITNFMTNAMKFTTQGHIAMGFNIVPDGIKLYVKDTGCGMNDDEKKRVFERFEKFNTLAQGTGLGTSIAKAIVDVYHGKIGVESTPGKGSTFWAILPTYMEENDPDLSSSPVQEEENASDKKISERDCSNVRILVAEDNDSNYLLIKVLLKGYDLTHVYNGQEAVNMAKEQKFDLILMDVRMPVMDGLEATQHIREFNTQIPIIAVTANAFEEDKKRAYSAGVNDFLTKPIKKAELITAINQY